MSFIQVTNLVKEFKVNSLNKKKWFLSKKKYMYKRVVDNVNFDINKGEFVAYLGPNGAGKSTTIKMLSGVLVPSKGTITINGMEPHKARKIHARNIGVVYGQRTQLWWDLPLIESFKLLAKIYDLSNDEFTERVNKFCNILDISSFINEPVRKLSLGQRMRGDIAAALLHQPEILFLDEPTIGLDIVAKEKIHIFLKQLNRELGTTVLLTTHNLDDVEALCDRVIFIDKGKVLFDGSKDYIKKVYGDIRYVVVKVKEVITNNIEEKWITKVEENEIWIPISDDSLIPEIIQKVSQNYTIINLFIKESKIEDVVKKVFKEPEQYIKS